MSHLHDRLNRKSMPMKPSLDNAYAVPGLLKSQHIEIIIIQTETVFFFPSGYRPFLADFGRTSEGLQGLSTVGGTTENILYGVANLHALTDTARHDFVFIKPKKDSCDTKKTLTKQLP